MKRSSVLAGLLTIGLHAVALGCLSLWSVGGGDAAPAPDVPPGTAVTPSPSPDVPARRDTVSLPFIVPDRVSTRDDSAAAVRSKEPPKVAARRASRTEITPVLMISWQKGGGRRKTAGALPTLSGPLPNDVSASFKLMVAPDGRVRSVRVVKGKDPAFERAAVAHIKQWKFEPLRAGKPSDQLCSITLKAKAR
jgi:TonB family protein